MQPLKETDGKRKPASRSNEAELTAVCNLLLTGKSTPAENRIAVRHLLRQASKSLDRRS